MPLYSNGVLIPENTANVFTFNGVNVTDVFMNGVQVWNQSLFSATWSGSSIMTNASYRAGFETSGSQWRSHYLDNGTEQNEHGAWTTTQSNGAAPFTDFDSRIAAFGTYAGVPYFYSRYPNILGSGIKGFPNSYTNSSTSVVYTVGSGFTGASPTSGNVLSTSGGQIRVTWYTNSGSWITLN